MRYGRASAVGVALGLSFSGVGAPAHAQSTQTAAEPAPLSETLTGDAKTDYDTARQQLADGDFEGALGRFTRLYREVRDPRLLANVALCEKNLARCARAIAHFDEALTAGGGFFSASQTADIRLLAQNCASRVGRLRVTEAPSGAVVEIDDVAAGRAAAGSDIVVDAGTHRVRVRKAGYRDFAASISVAPGARVSLAAPLENALSKTAASPTPPPQTAASPTPPPQTAASPSGAVSRSALAPSPTSSGAGMSPMAAPLGASQGGASFGSVAVRTSAGNEVMLDGSVVGKGNWEGRVAPGLHSVSVSAEGMQPYRADIRVVENQTRSLDVTLDADRGASPWMWAIGGGIVLAGIVVAIVSVFRPADPVGPAPSVTVSPAALRHR